MKGRTPKYIMEADEQSLVRQALGSLEKGDGTIADMNPPLHLLLRRQDIRQRIRASIERGLSEYFERSVQFRSDKRCVEFCLEVSDGVPTFVDMPKLLSHIYNGSSAKGALHVHDLQLPLITGRWRRYFQIIAYVIRTRHKFPERFAPNADTASEAMRAAWRRDLGFLGEGSHGEERFRQLLESSSEATKSTYEGALEALNEPRRFSRDGSNIKNRPRGRVKKQPRSKREPIERPWERLAGDLFERVEGLVETGKKLRPPVETIRSWATRGRQHLKQAEGSRPWSVPEFVYLPTLDRPSGQAANSQAFNTRLRSSQVISGWHLYPTEQTVLHIFQGLGSPGDFRAGQYFRPPFSGSG